MTRKETISLMERAALRGWRRGRSNQGDEHKQIAKDLMEEADKLEQRTHSEGCWAWFGHHECAIREVERLQRLSASQEEAMRLMENGLL